MLSAEVVLILLAVLVLAVLLQPLADKLNLTIALPLVLFGFLGSELLVANGFDTGLRWQHVGDLTFLVFVPAIIFDAAFRLRWGSVRQQSRAILMLAGPLWFVSLALIAAVLYWGIGAPAGFPWIAAWLGASILAATDPGPLLPKLGTGDQVTLEAESLASDAGALVAFAVFLEAAGGGMLSAGDGVLLLVRAVVGGALFGLVLGGALWVMTMLLPDARLRVLGCLCLVYIGYLIAEVFLEISGVLALVVAAVCARRGERRFPSADGPTLGSFWGLAATAAAALLFVMLGVTVTLDMFTERWLAMTIGIAAVLVARAVVVFLVPGSFLPPGRRGLLFLGGVRGTVVVALALMLPTDLPYWWTIQSIAYGVVMFTLLVQLPVALTVIRRRPPVIT